MQVDLINGVVPISHAASHLAKLIRQTNETGKPIAITQKGRPEAVLIDVHVWAELVEELERLRTQVPPAVKE